MLRKINWLKAFGNFFIFVVVSVLTFVYYVFMFIVNMPHLAGKISLKKLTISLWLHSNFITKNPLSNLSSLHPNYAVMVICTNNFDWSRKSTSSLGTVPFFWVIILGFPFGWCRSKEKKILLNMPHFQAWEMPSLLCL